MLASSMPLLWSSLGSFGTNLVHILVIFKFSVTTALAVAYEILNSLDITRIDALRSYFKHSWKCSTISGLLMVVSRPIRSSSLTSSLPGLPWTSWTTCILLYSASNCLHMQSLAWQRFMLGFSEFNAQFDCITNLKSVFQPVLHSEYFFAVTKELIDLREKAVYGKIIFLNKNTYLK